MSCSMIAGSTTAASASGCASSRARASPNAYSVWASLSRTFSSGAANSQTAASSGSRAITPSGSAVDAGRDVLAGVVGGGLQAWSCCNRAVEARRQRRLPPSGTQAVQDYLEAPRCLRLVT